MNRGKIEESRGWGGDGNLERELRHRILDMSGCGVSDAKGKEEKLAQNARLVDQHLYEWYFSSHFFFSYFISFPPLYRKTSRKSKLA